MIQIRLSPTYPHMYLSNDNSTLKVSQDIFIFKSKIISRSSDKNEKNKIMVKAFINQRFPRHTIYDKNRTKISPGINR